MRARRKTDPKAAWTPALPAIDAATGHVVERFGGLSIEEVAAQTRIVTEALSTWSAETGQKHAEVTLFGDTYHAGEQLLNTKVDPFVLLDQVDQAVSLGADRIGHALVLGVSADVLVAKKVIENLTPDLPLVQALLVSYAFPEHPGFHGLKFERADQDNGADPGPALEALRAANPQTWSVERLEALIFEGASRAFGDSRIDPMWLPNEIYPGSRVGNYTWLLFETMLYDLTGAFDPAFSRHDALTGEWWLLQPVSPRLAFEKVAGQAGLELAGYLPPEHVDAEGRVVLVCYQRDPITDDHRISLLENNKFVAGWQKVLWTKDRPPLSDPAFDIATTFNRETGTLPGVTEDSYGSYKHSSELPPFPPTA